MEVLTLVKKKTSAQEAASETQPIAVEEAAYKDDLRAVLEEIRKWEGVIGYIQRDASSAIVDLRESAKITDYAILSSSAFNASEEFSDLFDLGDVKKAVVEGKDLKMLSLIVSENRISVFVEKNVDTGRILKRLHVS